ncbi:hypothetical protein C8J56DRAFT_926329 [Mycena floridula]|nr:hypothetical protein C8J56DRAFT_926329 [Mycena floridula]
MAQIATSQILFNSPALHSLKRDQLVKLCKIHSIKASGKNVDLIQKLKQHAQTLPKDSPLSVAARSEDTDDAMDVDSDEIEADKENEAAEENMFQMPRPSEQWEVVMETINEMEESSSQSTLSSRPGEFGTGSSKGGTVSSSIKALASSLGLKRSTSSKSILSSVTSNFPVPPLPKRDELLQYSAPYSSIPIPDPASAPQTDHFTFAATSDLLKKFDFNDTQDAAPLPGHALRPGIPAPVDARLSLGLTPATPKGKSKSGPTTTLRLVSNPTSNMIPEPRSTEPSTPQLKPFHTTFDLILGSPSHAMTSWPPEDSTKRNLYPALPESPSRAAPSLSLPQQSDVFIFGSPNPKHRVSDIQFRSAATSVLEEMNKRLQSEGIEGIGSNIIDSLRTNNTPASPTGRTIKPLPKTGRQGLGVKEKFERMHEEQFSKMESIVSRKGAGSASSKSQVMKEDIKIGMKRKSNVLGDTEGNPRRPLGLGRPAAAETRVISNGRRKAAKIPGAFGDDDEEEEEEDDDEAQDRAGKKPRVEFKDAEDTGQTLDATQREREAMRRKLEMNKARRRSSAGRPSLARTSLLQKPKPEAKPSRFGFISTAAKSIVRGVWGSRKPSGPVAPPSEVPKLVKPIAVKSMGPPENKKATISSLNSAKPGNSSLRPPSSRLDGTMNSTASSRSRSPIPSFNSTTRPSSTRTSTMDTKRSSLMTRGIGQMGTRTSSGTSSAVSSMGARTSLATTAEGSRKSSTSSSRLLAPTASSLAKTGQKGGPSKGKPLESVLEPRPIFSKPLVVPLGSGIPSPIRTAQTVTIAPVSEDNAAPTRQRTMGRKPRISRSKVIAKLASQRAASGPRPSIGTNGAGKIRSSMGANAAQRKSFASAGGSGLLMSAKKRARQSEYSRRKSRGPGVPMDV